MDEPTQIGDRLKQARNQKGYTLDDLQQLTKIQKRYLIAIEENRLEDLPGDFFVNAFIRQYAEVVDLPLEGVYEPANKHLDATQTFDFDSKEKVLPTRAQLKRSSKETAFTYSNDSKSSLPTFLLVLMFVLILGTIWYYIFYLRGDNRSANNDSAQSQQMIQNKESVTSEAEAQTSEETTTQETAITPAADQSGSPTYAVTGFELPNTLSIEVDASGNSWVSVTADGTVSLFEGTIAGGTTETISIEEGVTQVEIRVGYLPSTILNFGDQQVELPADYQTNQTQTLIFNIE